MPEPGVPAFMVRDTLRSSADDWDRRARDLIGITPPDSAIAPMLMASAYASVAADLLQWIEERHPDEALDIAASVDDVLTNGGSLHA